MRMNGWSRAAASRFAHLKVIVLWHLYLLSRDRIHPLFDGEVCNLW
jgi:hypothetical protein